jgi:hypothetical protein
MPHSSKKASPTKKDRVIGIAKKPFVAVHTKTKKYLQRRPHRSFRLTRRRDYNRSLKLPGYFAFTAQVNKTVWRYRRTLGMLGILYAALTAVLIGIGSQETYSTLLSTLRDTGTEIFQGGWGEIGQAALLLVSIGSTGLTQTPTESQQIYIVLVGLLIWLTTVWLLRNLMAGHRVKLRDGLYNAGAPLVSTFIIALVMTVQLLPIGLAVIGYSAASATGLLVGGVEAMLFWVAAVLLTVTSLYWITSTFFAMIIVTLPGMYPGRALRTAGDMVVSRRLRILLRILWMMLVVVVAAMVLLIPIILINTGLVDIWPVISNVPLVPAALMLFGVGAFIWGTSYIYLLYRKVVDDDAKPA